MEEVGFASVAETHHEATLFGSPSRYRSVRPAAAQTPTGLTARRRYFCACCLRPVIWTNSPFLVSYTT